MIIQHDIILKPRPYGFHLITADILFALPELPEQGLLHVFIQHTSAGICINENADPSVLADFKSFFNRLIPENMPFLTHTLEGPDDMPAHVKSVLTGSSVTIPITHKKLNLGIWQGIYLAEFRRQGGARKLVITVYS